MVTLWASDPVVSPTGQRRASATDGEREQLHHALERQKGHHSKSDPQNPAGALFVLVCIDLPACIRVFRIRKAIGQVSCFSGRNEEVVGGEGRRRRVREKKGFVPVNLFARYFTPGCLGREKHWIQITGENKIKSHAAAVEIWNALFMPPPHCSPPRP